MRLEIRLQKFLAECGVGSRRAVEKLIAAGKVRVNGEIARIGARIDPSVDKVTVYGNPVKHKEKKVYIKLNKPIGVVSAASDLKETTVVDLIKNAPGRLYPVGRLDMGSEGLMILTNDGALADRLMHPRYEHEKEYEVTVRSPLSDAQLEELRQGIVLDGRKTLAARVSRKGADRFNMVLREGKKRQIRRMVESLGNKVKALKRVRIGNIRLGRLRPGEYDFISPAEISRLSGSAPGQG